MPLPILDAFGRPAEYYLQSNSRLKSTEDDRYRLDRPRLFDDMAKLLGIERYKALVSDARWIAEAFPLVQEAVQQKAEYVGAAGWLPEFIGADRTYGARATRILHDALQISDLRGPLFDWDDQWELASRLWDIDGGSFQLFTQSPITGFPQVQNIEAHRIGQRSGSPVVGDRDASSLVNDGGTFRQVWGLFKGYRIINGIIYDAGGAEIGYRVLGNTAIDDRDVSANDMQHVCHPRWFSEGRPVPTIAYAVLDWYDVKETREFERLAQKINSALTLVESNETGEAPAIPPMGSSTAATLKTTGEPQVLTLAGGLVRYVRNGGSLKAHESNRPSDGWQKFDRTVVAGAFYGMGWRIEMMDLSLLGGAGVRGFQDNINMKIVARHRRVKRFDLRAARATMAQLIRRGDIEEHPEWSAWDVPQPPEFNVDAGRAMQQDRDNVRFGLDSTPAVIRRHFARTSYERTLREEAEYISRKKEIAAEFGLQPDEIGTKLKVGDSGDSVRVLTGDDLTDPAGSSSQP